MSGRSSDKPKLKPKPVRPVRSNEPKPRPGTAGEAARRAKNPGHPYGSKKTPEVINAFLESMAMGNTVNTSADFAGVSYTMLFRWRREDPEFAARWAEAVERGVDVLEQEALRRAVKGVEKPVYQQGQLVGTVTEYSDRLMEFMLRGKRAAYATQKHEVAGPNGGAIPVGVEVRFVDAPSDKDSA